MIVVFIISIVVVMYFYAGLATAWLLDIYFKLQGDISNSLFEQLRKSFFARLMLFPHLQMTWNSKKSKNKIIPVLKTFLTYLIFWLLPMLGVLYSGLNHKDIGALFISVYGISVHTIQLSILLGATGTRIEHIP